MAKSVSNGRKATRVDRHVGARLRARRRQLKKTQAGLGEEIGLSFKQIRKYEQGQNRIGAGTLYRLSQALGVRVDYFFDGLDSLSADGAPPHGEAETLAKEFQSIGAPSRRRALLRLVKSIADSPGLRGQWRVPV